MKSKWSEFFDYILLDELATVVTPLVIVVLIVAITFIAQWMIGL